ncbi:MAG TPA: S8 family serine peptidase [Draconibacterium sp.]|nr:S8 family serine peptidase [Draconibacterium sp.]
MNEDPLNEVALKSANASKVSYIVTLRDAELDTELAQLKGYENRQHAASVAADRILKRAGIADGEIEHVYGTALHGFSVMIPPGQLKKLQDDPSVKYIEKDQVAVLIHPTKGNPHTGGGNTGGGSTGQTTPWGVARVNGGVGGAFGKAWIIDTGIDLDHPDLNVDVADSKNFVWKDSSPEDLNGHGTHVAGTIAAIDNNVGVIGVAAGATVVAVRVLDRRGSGSYSDVIAGVNYVAENGHNGDVANMSLGGPPSDALDAAVESAAATGIKFALAAGNDSDDADNYSPARAEGSNIYTVSAMWEGDDWASFSNYGTHVDYCEPGVYIESTWKNGGYNTISGTSMATPHLAGILLLDKLTTDGTVTGDPDNPDDPIGVVVN